MSNFNFIKVNNKKYNFKPLGGCDTPAETAAKVVEVVDCENFTIFTGATIVVYFANKNTATNPSLNVNNTGAKFIYYNGSKLPSSQYWSAGSVVEFIYDGSYWNVLGTIKDNDTTCSPISDDDLTILLNTYLPYGDPSGAGISEALLDETEY